MMTPSIAPSLLFFFIASILASFFLTSAALSTIGYVIPGPVQFPQPFFLEGSSGKCASKSSSFSCLKSL